MASSPRFLLHGSGAIGTVYVYLLTKAGYNVTAVCRSNYAAANANGFSLDSDVYGKGLRFHPQVVQDPAEAAKAGVYDYVLVTTKSLPEAETSKVIAPAVTEGRTTIVLIQNGIGIENEFASAFPSNPLISSVVYLPTTQISPGHVTMGNLEKLELGTYPASAYHQHRHVKDAADQFFRVMKQAGSLVSWLDDIQERR